MWDSIKETFSKYFRFFLPTLQKVEDSVKPFYPFIV